MKLSMILSQLSTGMAGTISIFVLTLVFSLPLGLLIAFGRMSKNRIVSGIFRLYISLMRGTPLMLQLMVVYFGPFYLFGMNIGKWRFPAIITGFALNYGAYFAEIYRSGIVSMDRGQYEAAKLLGYSKGQTFVRIILPQVVKRILPAITNEVITPVKDTSLAFSISYVEMFTIAKQIAAAKTTMVPFVAAGIFYRHAKYVYIYQAAQVIHYIVRRIHRVVFYPAYGNRQVSEFYPGIVRILRFGCSVSICPVALVYHKHTFRFKGKAHGVFVESYIYISSVFSLLAAHPGGRNSQRRFKASVFSLH